MRRSQTRSDKRVYPFPQCRLRQQTEQAIFHVDRIVGDPNKKRRVFLWNDVRHPDTLSSWSGFSFVGVTDERI